MTGFARRRGQRMRCGPVIEMTSRASGNDRGMIHAGAGPGIGPVAGPTVGGSRRVVAWLTLSDPAVMARSTTGATDRIVIHAYIRPQRVPVTRLACH